MFSPDFRMNLVSQSAVMPDRHWIFRKTQHKIGVRPYLFKTWFEIMKGSCRGVIGRVLRLESVDHEH